MDQGELLAGWLLSTYDAVGAGFLPPRDAAAQDAVESPGWVGGCIKELIAAAPIQIAAHHILYHEAAVGAHNPQLAAVSSSVAFRSKHRSRSCREVPRQAGLPGRRRFESKRFKTCLTYFLFGLPGTGVQLPELGYGGNMGVQAAVHIHDLSGHIAAFIGS